MDKALGQSNLSDNNENKELEKVVPVVPAEPAKPAEPVKPAETVPTPEPITVETVAVPEVTPEPVVVEPEPPIETNESLQVLEKPKNTKKVVLAIVVLVLLLGISAGAYLLMTGNMISIPGLDSEDQTKETTESTEVTVIEKEEDTTSLRYLETYYSDSDGRVEYLNNLSTFKEEIRVDPFRSEF